MTILTIVLLTALVVLFVILAIFYVAVREFFTLWKAVTDVFLKR